MNDRFAVTTEEEEDAILEALDTAEEDDSGHPPSKFNDTEDKYNPNQARDPKGTSTGGQWSGGGTLSASGNEEFAAYAKNLKGTSPERVKMRGELKDATGAKKVELQKKILASFMKQHDRLAMKGKPTGALVNKIGGLAKKYGLENPVKITEASKAKTLTQHLGQAGTKALTQQTKSISAPGLTGMDKNSIAAYTGNKYVGINAALRRGAMEESQWDYVNQLNHALGKLPDHEGTVYRKADLTKEQAGLYKQGLIVEERAFTSSSKNIGTWAGSYRYEIKSKTGKDIQKFSKHHDEAEVLFRSGTRFRVLGVKVDDAKKQTYIRMEEV